MEGNPAKCRVGLCLRLQLAEPVCLCLLSRGPTFSFVAVTCVSVVSFLASCQGMTRYGVRVEDPSSHCDLMLCIAVL